MKLKKLNQDTKLNVMHKLNQDKPISLSLSHTHTHACTYARTYAHTAQCKNIL